MHDSGEREYFATGAMRDTAADKPRMELISPFAMQALGEWLRLGALKYNSRNWESGIPFTRCIASILRHTESFLAGDDSEDNAAGIMCNAMFLLHYQEMIRRGVLPEAVDDRPDYTTPGADLDPI